jgi:hypothetical protein
MMKNIRSCQRKRRECIAQWGRHPCGCCCRTLEDSLASKVPPPGARKLFFGPLRDAKTLSSERGLTKKREVAQDLEQRI